MSGSFLTVTVAVIARNEEGNIAACLAGLAWADELLVVDAESSDSTVVLARQAGARIVVRPFDTFARQRNYAIDQATGDWVLFVDADERVEAALAQEILQTLVEGSERPLQPVGYWVPRRNIMLGHWVRHAGWWPDYQMRLFQRGYARYDEKKDPHEVVILQGPADYLQQPLLHYNYSSIVQLFSKQSSYAPREARTLLAEGARARPYTFITQPLREFFRRYVQLQGYKDGPLGLLLAITMAWYRLQVYLNLRRLS